ncbi:MAG: hypothetical protein AAF264_14665, partial [Pseudomonadota bacterium]
HRFRRDGPRRRARASAPRPYALGVGLAILPLITLTAGCVAGGNGGGINSTADLEQNINEDLDGDGSVPNNLGRESAESETSESGGT